MKKFLFLTVLALIGVGVFFAWKAAKGEGGWLAGCCGWGEEKTDPWSTYDYPPADGEGEPE